MLIYPKWQGFNTTFGFKIDDDLCLNIKPFNLKNNENSII
jgi:hypothetical protein